MKYPGGLVPPGELGSLARKKTDRFEDPRDKRVTGESGSLANEPCVPVGRAAMYDGAVSCFLLYAAFSRVGVNANWKRST